jgi:hypothetical protein
VNLSLQIFLVVVPLCIEAAMEPAASCLPVNICCQWCLGETEVVVAEVLALAPGDEGCLWLATSPLTLPFLPRSDVV